MKKIHLCAAILVLLSTVLCSCFRRGPYSVPLNQAADNVVKVEILDARNESTVFSQKSYHKSIIYTLTLEEIPIFMEGLTTINFYIPPFEPSRHLGEIASRIYYKDGTSELIGNNCHYYLDADLKILDRGVRYPENESFYALFEQFVDEKLLPKI